MLTRASAGAVLDRSRPREAPHLALERFVVVRLQVSLGDLLHCHNLLRFLAGMVTGVGGFGARAAAWLKWVG